MAAPPDDSRTHDGATDPSVVFRFRFDIRFRIASLPFGVTPGSARVELAGDLLRVRFGPWTLETELSNVDGAEVTGPYSLPKVIGPPHLSLADSGVTFATNADQGLCIRFREPVPAIVPVPWVRHRAVTVTVADVPALAELLDRAHHRHTATEDEDVTVEELAQTVHDDLLALTASQLRERARELGIERYSRLSKAELVEVLTGHAEGLRDSP